MYSPFHYLLMCSFQSLYSEVMQFKVLYHVTKVYAIVYAMQKSTCGLALMTICC